MLALVRYGVPWDVAWEASAREREAWLVVFGENEGGTFDWSRKRWREPK